MSKALALTDVVLRDAHQSLLATRMRIEDMLPIAPKLDSVGFWSLESWGGATFDACIRYLGEDPWERIRALKQAMPNTPQQMLLRGQNLLGYRHYSDDLVTRFVERAHDSGVDVFRVFDAMNDVRNLQAALKAVIDVGAHAQGTISYTTSPVHTLQTWLTMAKQLEDMGCHSLCIKDMAGLLKPMEAFELISRLKSETDLLITMQCHATTGLSTATYQKAIEAGIDVLDTAISSMSQTYGHSATETLVAMVEDTDRATGYDLALLEEIAAYFREVRKKYARFEGALKGIDSRILRAQVPGGMLTNMENQLREQGAEDKLDLVPKTLLLGAAAQFGIFATLIGAIALNLVPGFEFSMQDAGAIAIIGGADGPTAIFLASKLAPDLLGAIAVAAYSYMALVPLIQPPIMRALTTEAERQIKMEQLRDVSKKEKIIFPLMVLGMTILFLPTATPLVGMFCLGNLMRESGVVDRLSNTAQNELINIVTIFLGLAVGSKLSAEQFLRVETLGILLLGAVAFSIGTAAGVLMAKLMCKLSGGKVNPLIGAAGVSAVPMAARVVNKVGLEANQQNFLLMHAMGPNVAGVLGSAVAAGILLAVLGN